MPSIKNSNIIRWTQDRKTSLQVIKPSALLSQTLMYKIFFLNQLNPTSKQCFFSLLLLLLFFFTSSLEEHSKTWLLWWSEILIDVSVHPLNAELTLSLFSSFLLFILRCTLYLSVVVWLRKPSSFKHPIPLNIWLLFHLVQYEFLNKGSYI